MEWQRSLGFRCELNVARFLPYFLNIVLIGRSDYPTEVMFVALTCCCG
jgi:hypothetical protein